MKLSDAMMLGSTNTKFSPLKWLDNDCGCLLGMAVRGKDGSIHWTTLDEIVSIWPWLDTNIAHPNFPSNEKIKVRAYAIISSLAISVQKGDKTLEQVVDWIRSVEPEEKDNAQSNESVSLGDRGYSPNRGLQNQGSGQARSIKPEPARKSPSVAG